MDVGLLKEVAKSYTTLDYIPKLQALLGVIYPDNDFSKLCKYELHRKVNNFILERYHGEQALKFRLFEEFRNKKVIAAFETRVHKSRVDFLTINGVSTSFEIKSSLDNLDKLSKQSSDYLKAFEYNNLIIDQRHLDKALSIVPETFGIWSYNGGMKKVYRSASLNKELQPEVQLNLLNKKELRACFGDHNIEAILNKVRSEKINTLFKLALKSRYADRWSFIVNHSSEILPIDIQFFFNTNIPPKDIYQY